MESILRSRGAHIIDHYTDSKINTEMDSFYTEIEDFFTKLFPTMQLPEWEKDHRPALQALRDITVTENETKLRGSIVSMYALFKHYHSLLHPFQCRAVNCMLSKLQSTSIPSSGQQEPEYIMKITCFNPENGANELRPDMCLYRSDDSNTFKLAGVREYRGRTSWAHIVSLIQINVNPSATPFNFDDDSFELNEDSHEEYIGPRTRTQMASFASEVYYRQHRKALFTAFIFQDRVRFIRWDRAGALVSRAYNYVRDPAQFLQFFYLLAMSNPAEQGYSTEFKRVDRSGDIGSKLQAYQAKVQGDDNTKNKWFRKLGSGLGLDVEEVDKGQPLGATLDPLYAVRKYSTFHVHDTDHSL